MLQNQTPIYFIDWCLFSAIGMEKYIGNLQFICATDTFYGLHPHIFVPQSFSYNHALTSEQTLNALLSNEEVAAHIRRRGPGKLLVWLLNEETERLAEALDLEICLPPHQLRMHWDNKANTNRLAEMAGVPCVPYVLTPVESYTHLRKIAAHLGQDLVIQSPHGMSGNNTFFISNEADWDSCHTHISNGEEMKIMKRIRCEEASLEACVTKYGVAVSPLIWELIGIPELTVYKGGWCGNELAPYTFPKHHIEKAKQYTILLGEQLRKVGYKGCFQPDYLIDPDNDILYLGEINMRFSGFTPLINNANIAEKDIPLLLLHLAEWLDMDYDLDLDALNTAWTKQEHLSPLSLLHFKNVKEKQAQPIRTGIYRLAEDGKVVFVRSALSPKDILDTHEAFWMSTSGLDSVIEKGDEIGALFIHSRMTVAGKKLTPLGKRWVEGLLLKSLAT